MKKITTLLMVAIAALHIQAQGYYIEMKVSMGGSPMADMKIYAQDGNSRSEVNSNMGGMANLNLIILNLRSTPDKVYMLDAAKRTYSESNTTSNADYKDAEQEDYEVNVIGKEKVNGYNTTHVRIKKKDDAHTMEMWTTTELIDYKDLAMVKSKYTGKANLYKQLEAKGAAGFPVRVKTNEMSRDVQIDLVKAEKRAQPASLFSLDGYTKTDVMNTMGIDIKEMMQKMQNMTPEERERMLKMLQQQYQSK